jgi:adenosylcobinamide-GDP ribazoletransferase
VNQPAAASEAADERWLFPPALRGARAAFVFFTRIPVGGFPYRKRDFVWASAYAPLVGLVLGGLLGGLFQLLLPLGGLAAAALTLGVSLLLTGAFHEDGLADTSDALGGGYTPEKVLSILKDSRIGSFGGAALTISILSRAALLAQLGAAGAWALPLAYCAARVGPIWQMASLPYVTQEGAAKSRELSRGGFVQAGVATAWLVLAGIVAWRSGFASPGKLAALAFAIALIASASAWRYVKRVGGITGDFLGATEQLGEMAALAVLAWPERG